MCLKSLDPVNWLWHTVRRLRLSLGSIKSEGQTAPPEVRKGEVEDGEDKEQEEEEEKEELYIFCNHNLQKLNI